MTSLKSYQNLAEKILGLHKYTSANQTRYIPDSVFDLFGLFLKWCVLHCEQAVLKNVASSVLLVFVSDAKRYPKGF